MNPSAILLLAALDLVPAPKAEDVVHKVELELRKSDGGGGRQNEDGGEPTTQRKYNRVFMLCDTMNDMMQWTASRHDLSVYITLYSTTST